MTESGLIIDGRFMLDRELGRGTCGVVRLATDLRTRQLRIVKLIKKIDRTGSHDTTFDAEVAALNALQTLDGVPKLFCAREIVNFRFLVMEVLDDDLQSLRKRNTGHVFKLTTSLQLLWHIIKSLEAIHKLGIVHRDLKLANMMIRKRENTCQLVIIDFGLAASFRDKTTGSRISVSSGGYDFRSSVYSAPRAAEYCPYMETEDLIQAAYSAAYMRSNTSWISKDIKEMLKNKINFGRYPEAFLRPENLSLAPVIKMINNQKYGQDLDYNGILELIRALLDNQGLSTVFNVGFANGRITLK